MSRFVNDPVVDAGAVVLAARRMHAGEVFGWEPKVCSLGQLLDWLADPEFAVLDGVLYRSGEDVQGPFLRPVVAEIAVPCVFVKWLSAPVEIVSPEVFKSQFCVVEADVVSEPVVKAAKAAK